jgi:hypothetical protein
MRRAAPCAEARRRRNIWSKNRYFSLSSLIEN